MREGKCLSAMLFASDARKMGRKIEERVLHAVNAECSGFLSQSLRGCQRGGSVRRVAARTSV